MLGACCAKPDNLCSYGRPEVGHSLLMLPPRRGHFFYDRSQNCNNNEKGRLVDEDQGGGTVASSVLLLGEEGGSGAVEPPPPPMVYSIRSGDNRIGNFILHKADFCAGDIVLGNFDFSEASTRCLQVRAASLGGGLFVCRFAGGSGMEDAFLVACPPLTFVRPEEHLFYDPTAVEQ